MNARGKPFQPRRFSEPILLALGLVAAGALLSGCMGAATEDIWLDGGERWRVELALSLSEEERALMEGDISEEDLEDLAEELGEDITFRWDQRENPDGGITYSFFVAGKGFDNLREVALDQGASIYQDESDHVHISWYPSSASSFRSYTLTIHGGEIVSSNADEETSNSATWHNPTGRVQIELTEGGSALTAILATGFACVCLTTLMTGGVALVIALLRNQRATASLSA